jgi:hypothetical protein
MRKEDEKRGETTTHRNEWTAVSDHLGSLLLKLLRRASADCKLKKAVNDVVMKERGGEAVTARGG